MSKQTVNIRAIDTEELFQIIHASNGIYQSTLVKLLQCNRTSLESRLKTLKQNELIHKRNQINTSVIRISMIFKISKH